MDVGQTIFHVLEIIGVVAFALSGAMTALERDFDIFGVIVMGITTALGGGMTRDIILGRFPPAMFENFSSVLIAIVTSLATFVVAYIARDEYKKQTKAIDQINNIFDAIGLGVFSVLGVSISIDCGHFDNTFLCIFLGTITGVGGGLLRDIMSKSKPMIFVKRIYAIASIAGSAVYYLLLFFKVSDWISITVSIAVTFVLRILATKFEWSLPKVNLSDGKEEARHK